MGDCDAERDDRAVDKYRADNGKIAGMRATFERIIGQKGIAGPHLGGKAVDDESHLLRKRAGKYRDAVGLRDEVAAAIADAAGEV